MSVISKKLCLVGDFGVGKTSLIRRFVDRQFSDQYLSTVGVKISRKLVEISTAETQKQRNLQLLIWDIEGSTKFKAIAPSYLQGAGGAIIVGDVTRQETLDNLPEHVHTFLSMNRQGHVVIALNKADVIAEARLDRLMQSIQFVEQERVLAVYATSAKTGKEVDHLFESLVHYLS